MNRVKLAWEWYSTLTPLDIMRKAAKDEVRAEWSKEDGCLYAFAGRICDTPAIRVHGRMPPMSLTEPLALDLCVPVYIAQWNKWALPDGRPLFMLARCRELSTIFIDASVMIPIDYVKMCQDELWVCQMWDRCCRHVPNMVADGLMALT